VMGLDGEAKAVVVRWPGGKVMRKTVEVGAWECRVKEAGEGVP
jgi:hypothetical protein